MSEFLFKTRHNANPKGKPRVYFTCHPEDFEACFCEIANDILDFQDCAIYYTEDMTASIDEEERDATLGYMDLFVVPITAKLLGTPNRALEQDIPYAQNAKISVLPVFMEADSVLDKWYAGCALLNGVQYLTRKSGDPTEKSYRDKLSAYLEAVLVGDALAERVRAAFDAYIFLSYRKKDRRYANELMKRIHEIPEFRDVAIWYDEFLTPGEDFHENIAQALKSCALFALVVTPNILEEPNFVADTEYPMALEAVMCVIPAEMEKTDREALAAKFRNIPECINPDDPAQLTQRMLENLPATHGIHINEAAQSFLIGMAYLKGIDVEINRERGIALITAAAEAGHTEAVEKLYNLYSGEEGSGYKSQYRAIPWGEKLVEIRAEEWGREHPNTQTLIAKLAASYSEAGNSDRAKTLLEDVYKSRCHTLGENHSHTVTALHNLAVEYAQLGQLEKALELWQKVYVLRCDILGETHPDTLTSLHNMGGVYLNMGNIRNGLELLEKAYIQGKAALGEVHPTTIRMLSQLARAFHQYGDSGKAIRLLEAALPVYRKELGEKDSATYGLICDLGDICLRSGNMEAAARYLDPLIEKYAEIYGPDSNSVAFLIQTYDDLGYKAACDDLDAAARYWGKAYDLNDRYLGATHETTQSTFRSLLELLPDVSEDTQAVLLARVKAMLEKLCDANCHSACAGLSEEKWCRMMEAMKRAFRDQSPKVRAEYWILFYDCIYYYCGNQDKHTLAALEELKKHLPEVSAASQAAILERIEQMLQQLRLQVQFGSFNGTTTDGLKLMLRLLRLYRTYGAKRKRIALLEMFRELCALCCSPESPIFAKLEEMLAEDQSLPD